MKFRTNAQKKRIDVWLIYRCERCSETWNLPVFERVAIGDIPPDEFNAIAHNDAALANLYAFDRTRLARHAERVEESADASVEWLAQGTCTHPAEVQILIRLILPWRARLDRFLAQQLGMSRPSLCALEARGGLTITPPSRKGLRASLVDGQQIGIKLCQDARDLALIAAIQRRASP